jgi:hypothetical protein
MTTGSSRAHRLGLLATWVAIAIFLVGFAATVAWVAYPRSSATAYGDGSSIESRLSAPSDLPGEWQDTWVQANGLGAWTNACLGLPDLDLAEGQLAPAARVDMTASDLNDSRVVSAMVFDMGSDDAAVASVENSRLKACPIPLPSSVHSQPIVGLVDGGLVGYSLDNNSAGVTTRPMNLVAGHHGRFVVALVSYASGPAPLSGDQLATALTVQVQHLDEPGYARPRPPLSSPASMLVLMAGLFVAWLVVWPAVRAPIFGVVGAGSLTVSSGLLALTFSTASDVYFWLLCGALPVGAAVALIGRSNVSQVHRRKVTRRIVPDDDRRVRSALASKIFQRWSDELAAAGFVPVGGVACARSHGRVLDWAFVDPPRSMYAELSLRKRPPRWPPSHLAPQSPVTLWTPLADHRGILVTMGWRCDFPIVPTELRQSRPGASVAELVEAHATALSWLDAQGVAASPAIDDGYDGGWERAASRSREWLLARPLRTGLGTLVAALTRRAPGRGDLATHAPFAAVVSTLAAVGDGLGP